jgi:deazaflavin-dependent oxidoreductase (nitroreductase family)
VLEWADAEFCYLTTTGRRTGRAHSIEIWFGVHDGRVYLLSGVRDHSDWVRNIQANATVTVRAGEQVCSGRGRVIEPGTPEDALARELLVTKYEPIDQSSMTEWGRTSLLVAVDLVDG